MSASIPQPAGGLHLSEHPARWAWIALAILPVVAVLAVVVAFTIGGALDLDMFNDASWTAGEYVLVYGPAAILIVVPPALGTVLGYRAMRMGSRSGKWALIVNGLVLAVVFIGSVYGLTTAVVHRM